MKKRADEMKPVLVTTEHCGVFFGYADNVDGDVIELKDARLCVYWTAEVKGFMGLASHGPVKGCRIGNKAPSIKLRNITAVLEVSPKAVERWEADIWD